jgi:hypothetical protein
MDEIARRPVSHDLERSRPQLIEDLTRRNVAACRRAGAVKLDCEPQGDHPPDRGEQLSFDALANAHGQDPCPGAELQGDVLEAQTLVGLDQRVEEEPRIESCCRGEGTSDMVHADRVQPTGQTLWRMRAGRRVHHG